MKMSRKQAHGRHFSQKSLDHGVRHYLVCHHSPWAIKFQTAGVLLIGILDGHLMANELPLNDIRTDDMMTMKYNTSL